MNRFNIKYDIGSDRYELYEGSAFCGAWKTMGAAEGYRDEVIAIRDGTYIPTEPKTIEEQDALYIAAVKIPEPVKKVPEITERHRMIFQLFMQCLSDRKSGYSMDILRDCVKHIDKLLEY